MTDVNVSSDDSSKNFKPHSFSHPGPPGYKPSTLTTGSRYDHADIQYGEDPLDIPLRYPNICKEQPYLLIYDTTVQHL
ncbi:hypothetical protein M8J77_019847 [Diaphorina citri]|nr:hypothetical protein M8J77_019847 [Diaphorina citri]